MLEAELSIGNSGGTLSPFPAEAGHDTLPGPVAQAVKGSYFSA